jgi:HlyD family secretion protein
MSSASAPTLVPKPASSPAHGDPSARSAKSKLVWGILLLLLIAAAIWWARRANTRPAQQTVVTAIRTATVYTGTLQNTIRLTGTTGAKDFAMLITPTLRGSRADGRREARVPTSGVPTDLTVRSSNRGPSSTGTGGTDGTSTDPAAAAAPSSTAGSSSGLSTALQSSTSRVGRPGGAPTSSNLSTGPPPGSGGSPLGSTSGELVGGGGGGGFGGGDFGLLLQKTVDPGSKVRKGQVIAEFDRQNQLNRLDDYRASVAQTEAAVKRMKAELEVGRKAHDQQVATAKADLDKATFDLKAAPVLGAMDTERLKLALEEAEARYKELVSETKFIDIGYEANYRKAQMDLEQARLELKRAQANVDRMLVKAPMDGLTVMQQTFRGSEFAPIKEGDQLYPGQSFMQVVNTSTLIVNATINQVDIERLRLGQKAKIRFDAYPGLEVMGHVYAIAAITKPGGMRASFVKEVPVQIRLDEMDARIIPDLSVSVDVITETEEQATIAPLSGIFKDDTGKAVAYVKKDDDWEKRNVELGLSNNIAIVVKSGLRPGENIAVTEPPHKLVKQAA